MRVAAASTHGDVPTGGASPLGAWRRLDVLGPAPRLSLPRLRGPRRCGPGPRDPPERLQRVLRLRRPDTRRVRRPLVAAPGRGRDDRPGDGLDAGHAAVGRATRGRGVLHAAGGLRFAPTP